MSDPTEANGTAGAADAESVQARGEFADLRRISRPGEGLRVTGSAQCDRRGGDRGDVLERGGERSEASGAHDEPFRIRPRRRWCRGP